MSIPYGYGLCDGLYRFVFEGGGHVHRFRRSAIVAQIEAHVGVRLIKWQNLYSSFLYLRRLAEMFHSTPPPGLARRLQMIGRLPAPVIESAQFLLHAGTRVVDRILGTELALYGWALYFARSAEEPVQVPGYLNVCLYCGAGHPASDVPRRRLAWYRCTCSDRMNPYFAPFRNTV